MPLEAPLMSKAARLGLNLADLGPILLSKINNGALDAVDPVPASSLWSTKDAPTLIIYAVRRPG